MVVRPHFDLPFRFGLNNSPAVVEQGSYEDIRNCVHAAVRTERGTRLFVPEFGVTNFTFENMPIKQSQLEREIQTSEPRAGVSVEQIISDLTDELTIGVDTIV